MKKTTNSQFIQRAKEIYGDKYDYSKTNYINSDTKVIITCSKHGNFEKRPLKFLTGRECYECKKVESDYFGKTKKNGYQRVCKKSS